MRLFTPEGERLWVEGWDPRYPGADTRVFVTAHGGHETVWVTVAATASCIQYARVAHDTAGTVTVEAVSTGGTAPTTVEVTYELTALHDAGRNRLADFHAGFPAFIAGWETEIGKALAAGRRP